MAITRINQANGAGDELVLAQDIYTGEVLKQFKDKTRISDSFVVTKKIKNGKSASFKATGIVSGGRHQVGDTIVGGGNFKANEKIINVEDRVYTAESIEEIDEFMADYPARSIMAEEMGEFLASTNDYDRYKEMVKGCRSTTPNVVGGPVGSQITNLDLESADVQVKAAALEASIFEAGTILKQKNITGEVVCFLNPVEYAALVQNTDAINKDWGGEGSLAKGSIAMLNGIKIIETNSVKREDTSVSDTYHGVNSTNTYGVIMVKGLVGEVVLQPVRSKLEKPVGTYSDLVSSSYIKGLGFLRPECGVELISAAIV